MKQICPAEFCTGCGACLNSCRHSAITMHKDVNGFVYPVIDSQRCVDCAACQACCPSLHEVDRNFPGCTMAVAATDRTVRSRSSSGGVATVAGNHVIARGGVVYGCAQYNAATIAHIRVSQSHELSRLQGSKYVQSDMGLTYQSVKEDLQRGIPVLFSGTPCQVAGLKCFLKREYAHLLTMDLVCHGVPNQEMLAHHVASVSGMEASSQYVLFRWKSPWRIVFGLRCCDCHTPDRIRYERLSSSDSYMSAFLHGLSFRESCYSCKYATQKRVGDLTIGDFWGLGSLKETSFTNKGDGVSLVLLNSSKGKAFWEEISSMFEVEERTLGEATRSNGNLVHPTPRPSQRERFLSVYRFHGLDAAIRAVYPWPVRVKRSFMESLKGNRAIVALYKRVRLTIHTLLRK